MGKPVIPLKALKIMRRLDMKVQNPDKHAGRDIPRQLGKKQALESALTVLLEERSVNENSVTSYTSIYKCFTKFTMETGYLEDDIWPQDITRPFDNHPVLLWLVEMVNENLAAGTIASRISGLKWFCETRGRPHDLNAQIVSRVMGAARRCNSRVADKAKPVTPENLRTFRIICNHICIPVYHHGM